MKKLIHGLNARPCVSTIAHCLLPTACCLLLTYNSFAWTNYVSAAGSETAPYDTWAKAAKSIQPAVDYAVEGNVVLVADDTYTVASQIIITTNNIILKSVNGAANTAINGNSTAHCIYLRGDSVIDGFSIINSKFSNGGGIFVQNYGTILNCIFTNNFATVDGGAIRARDALISNCYFYANGAENGGAVYMRQGCSVKDCTFVGNSGTHGGAIYSYGVNAGSVSGCVISNNNAEYGGGIWLTNGTSISSCTISGNNADYSGGGGYCKDGGVVSNCTISGNSAGVGGLGEGGGVFCNKGGSVFNCTISGNSTDSEGGGVYCALGGTISACTISGNSAGWAGGGVYCSFGGTISACTISGNNAVNYGGGVYCDYDGVLTNCLIIGANSAKFGGGVTLQQGGELYNCTIAGNSATDSGGGINCSGSGMGAGTIINTIIYDNQAAFSNDNWKVFGFDNAFGYSCTFPIAGLPGGNGCISNNPEFITPGSDYHLQDTSPCRNSGSNMVWMIGATDLDGNPRLTGGTVDMGCYEFIPEPGMGIWIAGILELWIVVKRQTRARRMPGSNIKS